MAFTPEQRAKALATRKANLEKKRGKQAHIEVASTKGVSPSDEKTMKEKIADLEKRLAESEAARSDAERVALQVAESQGALMQRQIEEVPTGKTATVMRLDHYKVVGHKENGQDILRPVMKAVKLPTFFYKIDMPPCGGTDLKMNGTEFYHGAVYEFDIDTLRSVKDIVYRTWKHDADIHGSDENFYRKPTKAQLSMRGRA